MPGGALPVVGESGRTLEYPAPLLTMLPQLDRPRTVPGLKSNVAGAEAEGQGGKRQGVTFPYPCHYVPVTIVYAFIPISVSVLAMILNFFVSFTFF